MSKSITRKKVSIDEVNLSKMPVGFKFEGDYVGMVKRPMPPTVSDKGEIVEKSLSVVIVENNGVRAGYIADKGLLSQLENAQIKEGMNFEAVKLEKKDIGKGRTMNTWEIYV